MNYNKRAFHCVSCIFIFAIMMIINCNVLYANDMISVSDVNSFGEGEKNGICGVNVTWSLSDEGVLTITGTGDMYDYTQSDNYDPDATIQENQYMSAAPWYEYRNDIRSAVVEEGVTSIGANAFRDNGLDEITMSSTVEKIGSSAFNNASYLSSVVFSNNLKSIGSEAFVNCRFLTEITLPSSLNQMDAKVFSDCIKLNSVKIENGLKKIPERAFAGCSSLSKIELPQSINEIGEYAFLSCSSLKDITLPKYLIKIDAWAFGYCKSLEKIEIPDRVDDLTSYVFSDCTNLQSVKFPSNLSNLGTKVFSGCTKLKNADIPEGTKVINSMTFMSCTGLESVTIPASTTIIAEDFLKTCTGIRHVYNNSDKTINVYTLETRCVINDKNGTICKAVEKGVYSISSGNYSVKTLMSSVKINTIGKQALTGSQVTPDIVLTDPDTGYILVKDQDFTISYSNNVNVGIATINLTGKGNYYGTNSTNFEIIDTKIPGRVSIKKPKNTAKKTLVVNWKKLSSAEGYQVQIATNNKFTKGKKAKKIKKGTTVSTKFTKLKKQKTYYIRVRAFAKNAQKKTVYGTWSAVKKIKIKK